MAKLFYEVQNFTSVSVALGSLNPTRDNRLRGTKLLFPTWRIGRREESKEGHLHMTSAQRDPKSNVSTKLSERSFVK